MNDAEDIRAVWDRPELRGLWERARQALEAPERPATFRLELPDEGTRREVGNLYGRPMWGQGTRINVSKLDEAVRGSRFGRSLEEVLEILHERPVTPRESDSRRRRQRGDRTVEVLGAALAEHGLGDQPWATAWQHWVRQYGRVAEADLESTAARAAAVLARLVLDPSERPRTWRARTDLAARFARGAHGLDNGTTLSRVVLRAAAMAHGVDSPGNERERRNLWERCGVTLDGVSATVPCWALPLTGADTWSGTVRERTEAGVPTHLTQLDLRAAPPALVEPGTVIAVCENPRVLEATVTERVRHPLICVSGNPTTVALELLDRLRADGAVLRYHGDFDWSGLSITASLYEQQGVVPWRMSASDYREAVNRASALRTDLQILDETPTEAPWDPELPEVMSSAGRVVEEEIVLDELLDDLRNGLGTAP
ncbi:TIGR02679 family protein [Actinopolyspora xinjiangensis]|uniref:TIGR02679 family protein n=1 Tax=Actinopolyspora xinjiangensis TaxID=405564 RepID=A0A1H0UFC3_9ACTN|nr:TIGR02679 family protein [Actinopolyspora xinjiangensis]SDP64760.1 TIGR02679 family protein [Actinopolyspora xinjiangensis]